MVLELSQWFYAVRRVFGSKCAEIPGGNPASEPELTGTCQVLVFRPFRPAVSLVVLFHSRGVAKPQRERLPCRYR